MKKEWKNRKKFFIIPPFGLLADVRYEKIPSFHFQSAKTYLWKFNKKWAKEKAKPTMETNEMLKAFRNEYQIQAKRKGFGQIICFSFFSI